MQNKVQVLLIFLLLFSVMDLSGMEPDSSGDVRNLRFSMLGGPGYNADYGLMLGGAALFTFSTNVQDTDLKRSVLPLGLAYMVRGGGGLRIRPQLFFHKDRFRIFGDFRLSSTHSNYYGVGYSVNRDRERGPDSTLYRNIAFRFNPIFLFRVGETDLFVGISMDLKQVHMKDPSEGVQMDANYLEQGGTAEGLSNLDVGPGVNFSYDTRDIPANAWSGIYLDISAHYYPRVMGSSRDFGVFRLEYRQFRSLDFLGPGKTLAWMVSGRYAGGDVPLCDLSTFGSPFDLRGYYRGQFRDRKAMFGLLEYRHKFDFGDKSWFSRQASRLGFAAWGGLGSIDPDFRTWSGIMPNYGMGLRIEVQARMNFRIDVGRDPITRQTLLYINMTEAF